MCGIAGIFSEKPMCMVPLLHDLMIMLQHRGHEAAGAVFFDGRDWIHERRIAENANSVAHFFGKFGKEDMKSIIAGGHTRYSTAGGVSRLENAQPLFNKTKYGDVAIAHNGTLVFANRLREELQNDGLSFAGDSDSEIILKLIARSNKADLLDAIVESLKLVQGAYSILIFCEQGIIAARDPYGFRPLSIAEFDAGYMVASETCSFDALKQKANVKFLRDVEPGEIVTISKQGLSSIKPFPMAQPAQCIFELIYFARPDSIVFGWPVYKFRKACGQESAKQFSKKPDCVIGIPDSANYFADGRSCGLGISHNRALVRNHASGRTFIDADSNNRSRNIRLKLNPIPGLIEGQNIDLCDDSIVRGNTSKKIVKMVRGCQPKSISFSIGAPPIMYPCFYGIDIPDNSQLIAAHNLIEDITKTLNVDSLNYLPLESLRQIGGSNFCYGCFNGKHPLI